MINFKKNKLILALVFFYAFNTEAQDFTNKLVIDSIHFDKKTSFFYRKNKLQYWVKDYKRKVNVSFNKSKKTQDLTFFLDSTVQINLLSDSIIFYDISNAPVPLIGYGHKIDNNKTGTWYYFELYSKKMFAKVDFKNDLIDGELVFYNFNKTIGSIHSYVKGVKNGRFFGYNPKGRIVEEGYYENGEITLITTYQY